MKKFLAFLVAFNLLHLISFSQVEQVSGAVYSTNGFPIRDAKVQSGIDKKSVLTDSAGNFSITMHLPDNLLIRYDGFESKKVPVTKDSLHPLSIQLTVANSNGTSNAEQQNGQSVQNTIDERSTSHNSFVYAGSGFSRGVMFPSFTHKEDTKGSQYLLGNWVKGNVRGKDSNLIANAGYVYNYDKTSGSLIMTNDMQTAVTIDNSQISRFTLMPKSGDEDSITFLIQPLLDKNAFVQLLADGNKYKLYKQIKTTFKKANYQTSGLTSSGNDYDEYVDQYTYYVLQTKDNLIKEIALKSKAIKSELPSESAKIDSFFNQSKISKPDENSLVQLINLLNQ